MGIVGCLRSRDRCTFYERNNDVMIPTPATCKGTKGDGSLCLRLKWPVDDVTLCPTIRKPFDILAKGLFVQSSRGERTRIELFLRGAASIEPQIRWLIVIFVRNNPPT
jgi:hypothetical protein